mmetsp:Transcript_76351/g.181569  ORF Transcript_76351/g.181569 Transcript_76351/m.181569 type:complete len:109 (+) Transcript_76351:896-1222(+)
MAIGLFLFAEDTRRLRGDWFRPPLRWLLSEACGSMRSSLTYPNISSKFNLGKFFIPWFSDSSANVNICFSSSADEGLDAWISAEWVARVSTLFDSLVCTKVDLVPVRS